jgi:hypothetical protein
MSRRLRHLRTALRSERGFTLTEMVVSAGIGIVVLIVALTLLDAATSAKLRVDARVDGTQRGRVAMEKVTQRLGSQSCSPDSARGSGTYTPIVAADGNSVTFYSDLGGDDFAPEKRRLFVSGGDLREEVFDGTGTPPAIVFPSTPTSQGLLLEGVIPVKDASGTVLPHFRFYAFNAATPAQPTEELRPPISAADLQRIVRVEAAFKADTIGNQDERVDTNFLTGVTSRIGNPRDPDPLKRGPQCE